ncbi:hypothetical protein A9Z42_0022410 [Trichoderma parareesei]|uniref:Xylanolytic transcriptional activator regulatory domain-containing protein n=1 Tax=Trichoderma parareesei TaxID=858221 RepID=A0A2H2Z256_TRIPA|nr:hypothetical protein A9Z42_0022410 [Trichoderma parareesei]
MFARVAKMRFMPSVARRLHLPPTESDIPTCSDLPRADFLQNAQLAEILFITPPDDLLLTVIFNPATVSQKAWIVYVDFILLTLLQHDPSQADTVKSLKKNTDKALNDFRIFLEPSEINIQALMLLGCHGEQYASPNLSWMLVGHACRQAQALGLHKIERGSYTQQQRQLALFWSLFSVDKSCSLAFGRPMLLPTASYENVPLPDFQYLLGYHPHKAQPVPTPSGSHTSTFGAHFFIQVMHLAKLTGAVLNTLSSQGTATDSETLAATLQSWDATTNEAKMTIGVRAMRFQYLHILILLLRKIPNSKDRRVQAARDAIMLLPGLISNYNHVYNGLVWQLLYYPFTPFFTLFCHMIDHPSAPTTQQDLDLLTTTAKYFNSMKQLGSLPAVSYKLEKTALVFCNLAIFVTSGEYSKDDAQDLQSTATATSLEDFAIVECSSEERIHFVDASSSEAGSASFTDAFMAYLQDQDYSAQSGVDNTDIENLLSCLDSEGPSPHKRKRSFENTMDWFSWDTYYYCKDE